MVEAAGFLAKHPPFRDLERSRLLEVAASLSALRVAAGESVLVEDGPPGASLFVVRSGSMDLVHKDQVIDFIGAGDTFGHPTLLTALPPAFTVRAREDSMLYLVPRDVALDVLGRPSGVAFVADTLRDRLKRVVRAEPALPQARSVPVASLIHRPPVFCSPSASIRDAAKLMSDKNATALLVRKGEEVGIITNADLRDRVLAAGMPVNAPVSSIVSTPLRTIRDNRLAPEASIEMLSGGFSHLVVVDARGQILGIVSPNSLMRLDALSPFALKWSIAAARDEDAVVGAMAHLPQVFASLLSARVGAAHICRIITLQCDAATSRLLELAAARHGAPPVRYAWLALGSAARNELTLASDQDNALAYEGADDPHVDAYFKRVATDVNAGLVRCGFRLDISDVLASSASWRMSESAWKAVFTDCLEMPDRSHLVRAALSFDFRRVAGDLPVLQQLNDLLRQAPLKTDFLGRLARTATDIRSPLGFRQRLIGPIDLKKSGALPIENMARFYALANGVTVPATSDRLAAVQELGALDPEAVQVLREAFERITSLRLQHHAAALEEGRSPDNVVDSDDLVPLTRLDLQAALRAVAAEQKRLSRFVPLGM